MTVYFDPERLGLKSVGDIEWSDEPYEFDMTAVWFDPKTREFVWASDSGCSCPSPFEGTTEEDLTRGDFFALAAKLNDPTNMPTEDAKASVVELLSRARSIGAGEDQ